MTKLQRISRRQPPQGITRSAIAIVATLCAGAPVTLAAAGADALAARVPELRERRVQALSRAAALGLPVEITTAAGNKARLQRFIGNRPIYYATTNATAADTVSTDEVHAGGSADLSLDGSGQMLGIWDSGEVRATHEEFGGRVTNLDAGGVSNHATHVAGTMIAAGVNGDAIGMSPAATLLASDFDDDVAEMILVQQGVNPVIVSNHSYAEIGGWRRNFFGDDLWVWFGDVVIGTTEDAVFGFYGDSARDWDELARSAPDYLMVTAAGNDRNDDGPGSGPHWHFDSIVEDFVIAEDVHPPDGGADGYDTIAGGAASAKNILTVGAVEDIVGGYTAPGDVVMTSFSGWGPTDDGRIKPDIVANWVGVLSSGSASDTDYRSLSGTSRSTPNASGSFGLLRQHAVNLYGNPLRSATMRALAAHSADDAGNPGPDYSFGWGLMNTKSAALIMTNDALGLPSDDIHELTLTNGATLSLLLTANDPGVLRVTAAWTDPAATPPLFGVDPPDPMLVNDLDIRLIDPDGASHRPWVLDPLSPSTAATTGDNFRDPVEQIVVSPIIPGAYRLDVTHKGSLHGGAPQPVSIVVSRPCCTIDSDADTVPDQLDNCPLVPNPAQQNSDADSHGDACDNCTVIANENQCNTNAPDTDPRDLGDDNFGNACDADLDNDGIVNSFDLSIVRNQFGKTGDNDADIDCNGVINSFDLAAMSSSFGHAPGPGAPITSGFENVPTLRGR